MSDIPAGWAELLAAPLGPEAPEEIPLGALPCLLPLEDERRLSIVDARSEAAP